MPELHLPKRITKHKLYTEAEFRALTGAENRAERLLAAMLDDREEWLSDTDFHYLQLLRRAHSVAINELSPHRRIKNIQKLLDVGSKHRARKVLRDVQAIFPNLDLSNREMNREVYIHKVGKHIARLERTAPESPLLGTLYKLLMQVQGLEHTEENIPWDQWQLPIPEFSTDINDLPNHVADDIDHEEISE